LTKASLYVYFGPVAVLTCRRFDHTPVTAIVRMASLSPYIVTTS